MKYFKIKTGYGPDDYVQIDESELETAYYIFMTEGKAIFSGGPVRGKDIVGISEDWHKEMGYNRTYELGPEDYAHFQEKGITQKYKGILANVKDKVMYLMQSNQTNLIGKNADIIGFESKPKGLTQAFLEGDKPEQLK